MWTRNSGCRSIIVAGVFSTVFAGSALAGSLKDEWKDEWKASSEYGVTAGLSIGVMNGEANELVYYPNGSTLSHLIWTFDNVAVLTGSIGYKWNAFSIGVKGRINLTDDSTMDDFDFPGTVCGIAGPFCQSHHENTTVEHSRMLDVHAGWQFYRSGGLALKGLVGYKWDNNSWVAVGGTSNYTPPFRNIPVISYEQWWQAPYLGLEVSGEWNAWNVNARVIGSKWVSGRDEDNHHLRTLLYKDEFGDDNEMLAVNLQAGYRLSKNIRMTAGYDYERYFTAKGSTSELDYSTGTTRFFADDGAGGNSETHTVSIGVKVNY